MKNSTRWVFCFTLALLFSLGKVGCGDNLGPNDEQSLCNTTKDCARASCKSLELCQFQEKTPAEVTKEPISNEVTKEKVIAEPVPDASEKPSLPDKMLPEPQPEPVVEPIPEPKPEPQPEPIPEPTPEPVVEKPPKNLLPVWQDNPCLNLAKHKPRYTDVVNNWLKQDKLSPPPPGGLLVIGSSSIRLWHRLQKDFIEWQITHRGYGGSYLWDTVGHAHSIVIPYKPKAILVFAGTNDIAAGMTPAEVLIGYRCLVQKVRQGIGNTHIVFIGITPTPSRWAKWSQSSKLNSEVQKLANKWPGLHYIDTPSHFLKTGKPPSNHLFRADKLHLSDAGYTLWKNVIHPALKKIVPPTYNMPSNQPAKGERVLVDLGPNNPEDGASTKSPDTFGQYWNNWLDLKGGTSVPPGDAIGLKTTRNKATPWRIITASTFQNNGIRNGGLQKPDSTKLGLIAVGTATQDYFYVTKSTPGSFVLTGLDPSKRYTIKLFASRNHGAETRTTRYTLTGATTTHKDLTTSGNNIGSDGQYDGNDSNIAEFKSLAPNQWGKIYFQVTVQAGTYGYIALAEVTVE